MEQEKPFMRTKNSIIDGLLICAFITFPFFFSRRAKFIWPIGIIIIILLFFQYKIACFYNDKIIFIRPLFFKQFPIRICYDDVTMMDFQPSILLNSPGVKIYYKSHTGKITKAGFELSTTKFEALKKYVSEKNPKIKFTYVGEPWLFIY